MAKAKKADGAGEARVLADVPAYGLKAGDLLVGPVVLVKALTDGGSADPHPDAVDYAKANGAPVVTIEG